jgi:hypothetical protein
MKNQTCSNNGNSIFTENSIEFYFAGKKVSYNTNYTIRCEIIKENFPSVYVDSYFMIEFPGKTGFLLISQYI